MLNRTRDIIKSEYKTWIDLEKIVKLSGTYFVGRTIITFIITQHLNDYLHSFF
jgi:hypothetical protein